MNGWEGHEAFYLYVMQRRLLVKKLYILLLQVYALNGELVDQMVKSEDLYTTHDEQVLEFLVVGAGPAGIATIAVLRSLGMPYHKLGWVDPEFNVGRIGEFYSSVPANNTTIKFIDFINACPAFQECTAPSIEELKAQPPHEFPQLGIIIPALRDISAYFRTQLISHQGWLQDLHFEKGVWCAYVNGIQLQARHVILATGSHPRELSYENVTVIPLDHALDKPKLATYVQKDHTIGVIGGSHSGILILKYLYELGIKKIINLYRSPIVYTIDMGGWYMNAYDGLKGLTAQWAREVLEGPNPPTNIIRAFNDEENRSLYLPQCDKIVYSIGYTPNETPVTGEYEHAQYNDKTGIIAPGLFGIGIAFPEYYCDPLGNTDHRVGLTSFMDYAQRIIPQWVALDADSAHLQQRSELLNLRKTMLEKYADLFIIDVL